MPEQLNIATFTKYLKQYYPKYTHALVNNKKKLAKSMYIYLTQELLRHSLNNIPLDYKKSSTYSIYNMSLNMHTEHKDNYLLIPINIDN